MLANPIVEELILAAPTAELAMEMFALDIQNNVFDIPIAWCWTTHSLGTIRICPPLKVAKRFRTFVTWCQRR